MVMLQFFVVWRMTRLQSVGKLPKWQSKYILVVFVAYDDTQIIIRIIQVKNTTVATEIEKDVAK